MKIENWFLYVDAREENDLSHEAAVNLLRKNNVSEGEIQEIIKEYQKMVSRDTFEY